jgi:hypothetical protein
MQKVRRSHSIHNVLIVSLVSLVSLSVFALTAGTVARPAAAGAAAGTAGASVLSWPPGGSAPSPLAWKLTGSRYVPSTKRWNLVWADQIIPGNVTAGQLQFAAQNYAGTQKIWSWQANQFRAYNPDFLVLTYHLAAGLNPRDNADVPDPKNQSSGNIGVIAPAGYVPEWDTYFVPWLQAHGIVTGTQRFEQMFQHYDALSPNNRVWHSDPYWLMNLDNADWRQYLGDMMLQWLAGNQNEGVFFDEAVETYGGAYNPNVNDPSPINFYWWQFSHFPYGYGAIGDLSGFAVWENARFLQAFQVLHARFHTAAADYLVIPNVDQMVTGWYDPLWTDGDASGQTIDGAMMESFGNYTGSDMALTLERGLRHVTGRGKILIAQFYDARDAERLRRAGMYMLIKNENSFINILSGNGVQWYPEYEIDLGDQSLVPASLDSLRVAGSGTQSLWGRTYANGMVLCNTSDSTMSYTLPAARQWGRAVTSGGGDVAGDGTPPAHSLTYTPVFGSVGVPASGCVILRAVSVYVPVVMK